MLEFSSSYQFTNQFEQTSYWDEGFHKADGQVNDILEILHKTGALITNGHFLLSSGKHSASYVNKDALYPHTEMVAEVGAKFARAFQTLAIDAVVSPAYGGIALSTWTAHHLTKIKHQEVLSLYTERVFVKHELSRGYDKLTEGKNILIIEDTTTTGGSVLEVIESVKQANGNILAVGAMINRNPSRVSSDIFGVPFYALADYPVVDWELHECPLCALGIPINKHFGHGRKQKTA